jgi:hypothetical protein
LQRMTCLVITGGIRLTPTPSGLEVMLTLTFVHKTRG